MTDPGAKPVMLSSIDGCETRPNSFEPFHILAMQAGVQVLVRIRCQKPGCALEQSRVSVFDSRLFLAGHRMSSQESRACVFTEDLGGTLHDLRLRAADIG